MPFCPPSSDRAFAVRVNSDCRVFDFTLLFEDAIFSVLPASLFLLLVTPQILIWRRENIKLSSYRLAIVKLVTKSDYKVILFFVLILNIAFLIFRLRDEALFTALSLASSILDIIAISAAIVLSFLSDQRAVNPSYLLTLYFSFGSILSIPRLRSLWLIYGDTTCRSLWTVIFIFTTLAAFAESAKKESILLPEVKERASKEEFHGLWGRSLFLWINSVLRDGFRVTLQVEDLPDIDDKLHISIAGQKLLHAWNRDQDTDVPKKNRLLRATFRAYLSSCVSAVLPRLILIGFKFCQPFLITAAVNYVSNSSSSKSSPDYFGQALIGAYILEYVGMAIVTSIYWRQTFRFVTMMRAGLVTMIHETLMESRTVDVKESEAITLMEVDVNRIVKNLHSFHETWGCMVEIIIAVWLLERQLGATCVVPAIISLLSIVASIPVSRRFKEKQRLWVERIGRRVIVTAGALGNIKVVKMLGLKNLVYDIVQELREVELQTSRRFRTLLIWTIVFKIEYLINVLANIPTDLAPFATFLVYALVAIINGSDSLVSARAFTSLSLISLLTGPLLTFIQICPGLFQSLACFHRIEAFCTQNPPKADPELKDDTKDIGSDKTTQENSEHMIILDHAFFSWASDSAPVLKDIDLIIERRSISILTGPTGAGKSALLESIMGETTLLEGRMLINATRVAYCSQTPWIINDTIRNNITGGAEVDEKWYTFTLQACGLKGDLQQIPDGDMFKCGSNGVALSGGQKQRIALARAVYSKADVVLCDDIFSGLDSKTLGVVSKQLLSNNGYFREAGKSVIITTQNPRLFPLADRIISLEDKTVTCQTPSCEATDIDELEYPEDEPLSLKVHLVETMSPESSLETEDEISVSKKDDQSRRNGGSGVYRFYLERSGVGIVLCFAGAMMLESTCANVSSVWIQEWSSADEEKQKKDIGMYLGVYAIFMITSFIGLTAGCWLIIGRLLFIKIINRTAIRMHSDLLKAVLSAPFHFLYSSDLGSLVNRFSEDMTLIDMNLPGGAIGAVATIDCKKTGAASCLTKTVIICIFGKYFTASLPFFLGSLYLIQFYYLRTSRQVRLLDIEAKSRLVSHFLEAIQGVTMLKALGWCSFFQEAFSNHFRHSQRPFYMLYCIQQWLTLVLDLVSGVMAVILIAITVLLRDHFSGGAVGVALYMIMTFNQSLTQLIDTWISLETSIGAVFRVKTFMHDTPSESGLDTRSLVRPLSPFSNGAIEFINITATYGPSTTPILKGLSLNACPGEKIAVCGRSGSGKTSLILALLQMMELQQGEIKIDGINLQGLDPDHIRSCLSVVSQDQFFLPGTVRLNINPHRNASDEIIEKAIQRVGLWDRISSGGGLEMELKGSEWSVGEKQLLALARAMTIPSEILILDEATGSVDLETEDLMQQIITEHFKSHTVISVLHRYTQIQQFDRIVVIQDGIILEDDSPKNLLAGDTEFRRLYGPIE
ncbi:multidrug resistance-associated protein [Penicillium malachiteum]|uniref:Multidrug resistance-associated protein n=1 Tax=Penicillium malachiteum TaxID=1324776 RepID=A0AAD6HMP4_9EURO|nr:multidrug resistance-associated protein [Penicillium malachiteum]